MVTCDAIAARLIGQGLGLYCEVDQDGGYMRVISVEKNGAASRAGLQCGDKIHRVAGKDIVSIKAEDLRCLVDGPKFMPVRVEASREDEHLGPRSISLIAIVNTRHENVEDRFTGSASSKGARPGLEYSRRYMESFTEKYAKRPISSSPTTLSEGSIAPSAKSPNAKSESPRPASAPEQAHPQAETETLLQDMMKRERRRRMDAEEREQKLLEQISILKAGQHDSTLEAMKREIESLRRELEEERNLRRQAEEKLDRLEVKMSTASLIAGREHDAPAARSEGGKEQGDRKGGHDRSDGIGEPKQSKVLSPCEVSAPVDRLAGGDNGTQVYDRRQVIMEQARQLLSLLSSQRAGYRDQLQDTFVEENAHRMRLDLSQLVGRTPPCRPAAHVRLPDAK
mmetsp:Transcript_43540/g.137759  ORF Transcript_43540/g.137759 Transcript_43540/m.137759 type:complete len:396 (-) Transcript_43540:401-1588(-)